MFLTGHRPRFAPQVGIAPILGRSGWPDLRLFRAKVRFLKGMSRLQFHRRQSRELGRNATQLWRYLRELSALRPSPAFCLLLPSPSLLMQLSLGTSDVLILWLETCPQLGASSACIFANPVERQAFMALIWWRTLWKLQCLLISVDTRSFSYCINASDNLTSQWPSRDLESRLRAQILPASRTPLWFERGFAREEVGRSSTLRCQGHLLGTAARSVRKGCGSPYVITLRMRCFLAVLSKETMSIEVTFNWYIKKIEKMSL